MWLAVLLLIGGLLAAGPVGAIVGLLLAIAIGVARKKA